MKISYGQVSMPVFIYFCQNILLDVLGLLYIQIIIYEGKPRLECVYPIKLSSGLHTKTRVTFTPRNRLKSVVHVCRNVSDTLV